MGVLLGKDWYSHSALFKANIWKFKDISDVQGAGDNLSGGAEFKKGNFLRCIEATSFSFNESGNALHATIYLSNCVQIGPLRLTVAEHLQVHIKNDGFPYRRK